MSVAYVKLFHKLFIGNEASDISTLAVHKPLLLYLRGLTTFITTYNSIVKIRTINTIWTIFIIILLHVIKLPNSRMKSNESTSAENTLNNDRTARVRVRLFSLLF